MDRIVGRPDGHIVSGALIASRLFDVRPWDPALLVRAALLLVAATLVAAFIPAQRAGSDAGITHRIETRNGTCRSGQTR